MMPLETNPLRKKRILRISCIFVGMMLFLTFFSNTLNNLSLPRVSTEQPMSGTLIKEVTGGGVVQAEETIKIYSDQGRIVDEVRVKPGDKVEKGQIAVVLDRSEIERQLREELLRYDQMKLNLEKLTDFDSGAAVAERNLEAAKQNLSDKRALYTGGAISDMEVRQAENEFFLAEKALDDEKRRQRNNERDIKNQQDSIQLEELTIEKLRKKLDEESSLVSPVDGIIHELNVSPGSVVNGGLPVFSVADLSKGFETKIAVDWEKAQYLAVGDAVDINVKSLGTGVLKGKISEIADSPQEIGEKKDVYIHIPPEEVKGGERCDIYVNKKTKAYNMLVSNTAVGTDEKGRFVWVLKERKGPLGSEFYVLRAAVTVDDSDSAKTAVLNGISPDEHIVAGYNKSLSDGGRVIPE